MKFRILSFVKRSLATRMSLVTVFFAAIILIAALGYMFSVSRQAIRKEAVDVCHIHLDAVSSRQPLYFSISYLEDKANKDAVESFSIINYNPRK